MTYEKYTPDAPVGMKNKRTCLSHGMNIGVQYEEILAKDASSGCCNAPLLKYNYSGKRSWPVCSKCHYAFSNGIIEDTPTKTDKQTEV